MFCTKIDILLEKNTEDKSCGSEKAITNFTIRQQSQHPHRRLGRKLSAEGRDTCVSLLALGPSALPTEQMSLPFQVPHSFRNETLSCTISWYSVGEGRALNRRLGKAALEMPFPPSPTFNTFIYRMYCLLQVPAIPKMNIVLFAIKGVITHGL